MLNTDNTLDHLAKNPGPNERKLVIKERGLSDFQKRLIDYDKCFRGKLFDESTRKLEWGTRWDTMGSQVDRKFWKPMFIPSIGRDIVETHNSYLTGDDKFPEINVTTKDANVFSGLEPVEGYETTEEGMEKAQSDALQDFIEELLLSCKLQKTAHFASQEMLVKEECPVLIRIYGGKVHLTVPDRTWCDWTFSEDDPDEIEEFTETYFFTRFENDKEQEYLYQRVIDKTQWVQYERKVLKNSNGKEYLEDSAPVFYIEHNLGFCPVAIFSMPDCKSVFADEVLENIKGHIEWYNDIKSGIRRNMEPQWVLLRDSSDRAHMAGRPGGDNDAPLERATLWEIEGKSVQSFANQTSGYEMAKKSLEDECADIRRYSHVIDIPPDNQQSGVALMLRMAPQHTEVQRLRSSLSDGLKCLINKIIKIALAYLPILNLPEDLPRPERLSTFNIALDWGTVVPVTPDVIALELDNIERMTVLGFLSKDSAQNYLLPLVGVEDIGAEKLKIAQESEEAKQDELELANAAFALAKGDENAD